jgi:hypothetical protein
LSDSFWFYVEKVPDLFIMIVFELLEVTLILVKACRGRLKHSVVTSFHNNF